MVARIGLIINMISLKKFDGRWRTSKRLFGFLFIQASHTNNIDNVFNHEKSDYLRNQTIILISFAVLKSSTFLVLRTIITL